MTSEVVVMNKEAVAIAADSAATLTGEKIFQTNKIFTLSKRHPVGIMIYGGSQFMGVQWEIVIKEFRKHIGIKKYDFIEKYTEEFLKFLKSYPPLVEDIDKRIFQQIEWISQDIYRNICEDIKREVNEYIENNGEISENSVKEITEAVITEIEEQCKIMPFPESFSAEDADKLKRQYQKVIKGKIFNIFENLPIHDKNESLINIAISAYIKVFLLKQSSGIVIVGYGEKEIFPSFIQIKIFGLLNGTLKKAEISKRSINFNLQSMVSSFAQGDMVTTFMEGIDPAIATKYKETFRLLFEEYKSMVLDSFIPPDKKEDAEKKLNQINYEVTTKFHNQLDNYIFSNLTRPIIDIVSHLPKDELSEMAESLVNLTSLRRRVSRDQESVGGPVDVAIISKGDGFIWVKRKHYFDSNLNPQFMQNYYYNENHQRRWIR